MIHAADLSERWQKIMHVHEIALEQLRGRVLGKMEAGATDVIQPAAARYVQGRPCARMWLSRVPAGSCDLPHSSQRRLQERIRHDVDLRCRGIGQGSGGRCSRVFRAPTACRGEEETHVKEVSPSSTSLGF
jgi:hypothetical protein